MSPSETATHKMTTSPTMAGLRGRCPRCGQGKLFRGYLTVAESCPRCGLDYRFTDSGDGPAVFIILLVGFIVVGLALATEFLWHPPYWLHALVWIPLILGLSLGLLRPLKGWFIGVQYKHKAAEGRLSDD
jgi:uncharacterized protein (DUF983 family)